MLMMNTGHTPGRPAVARLVADLRPRHRNKNLPGFVVLCPDVPTTVGPPLWNSAFLPAVHQGTFIADKVEKQTETAIVGKDFDPKKLISYIHNDKFTLHRAAARARSARDARTGCRWSARRSHDPQLEAAIQSMEIAYRMQTEAPEVFDIRKESEATLEAVRPGQHGARLPDGRAAGRARRAHGAGLLRARATRGTRTATSRRTARTRRTPTSRSPR